MNHVTPQETAIVQTPQQRANTLEALNVMWPSVPEKNVAGHLGAWRFDYPLRAKPSCGSAACFGGWCAWWPAFRKQGVRADSAGAPVLNIGGEGGDGSDVAERLFGHSEVFDIRGYTNIDSGFEGSDHELVTHRLRWLLANSVVKG